MPTNQYHEPAHELSQEIRTFARVIVSLIEEADAINWYEQRTSVEVDPQAREIMRHAQQEEMIHFGLDLAFLLRKKPTWEKVLKNILFKDVDLLELAEHAEEQAVHE